MRQSYILLFFLMLFGIGFSQVGINTTTPSSAAVLHLESLNGSGTHGGFMPPIVTLAERATIPITAADDGMMIYLSDGSTRCVQFYNGTSATWEDIYCMPVPTSVYYQDFEATPATPTLTFSDTGNGATATGTGPFPAGSDNFSEGSQGYELSNNTENITFDPVDSSGFTSGTLTFDLASFSGTSGNGADGADQVEVLISTDGATYSSEITVNGNSNARWDFDGTANASGTYDGDNTPTGYTAPSGGTLTGANAYSTVTLSNLPSAATLYVRIRLFNNSSNEYWIIDNVVLTLI